MVCDFGLLSWGICLPVLISLIANGLFACYFVCVICVDEFVLYDFGSYDVVLVGIVGIGLFYLGL